MNKYLRHGLKFSVLMVLITGTSYSWANSLPVMLNEDQLIQWAEEENFNQLRISLGELAKKQERAMYDENFGFKLDAQANYQETKEKSFAQFIPVTSPLADFQMKLSKNSKYGLSYGVMVNSNQYSNNFVKDGTTSSAGAFLALDIYKDFLGSTSRAQDASLMVQEEIAKRQRTISSHAFVQEVRKLYWKIVANNESTKIAKALLKTTKELQKDTRKRYRSNIADKGDLSRISSQVEARNGQLYLLEFERNELLKTLKSLFPQKLGGKTVQLAAYNLDRTVDDVMGCTQTIAQHSSSLPLEYTEYDEVLGLLQKDLELSQKVNNNYDKSDLKLTTQFEVVGKEYSYSNSFQELTDNGDNRFSVGIQWTMPIGGEKDKTREIQDQIIKRQNLAQAQEVKGKLDAFHAQTLRSVLTLQNVIRAQKRNEVHLRDTLKDSKRKFKQARVTSQDLLIDENQLLNSNLDEISTKYQVIETIINYFTVFNQTPCKLNRRAKL
ncbi:TolC family protein [Halobacteriovorax sp. HFRX-2_2]|uniref:TolC family protein n=1 Tax=unclassified Halobacteriovorax TaxID=2639665 RepID=UPI003711975B